MAVNSSAPHRWLYSCVHHMDVRISIDLQELPKKKGVWYLIPILGIRYPPPSCGYSFPQIQRHGSHKQLSFHQISFWTDSRGSWPSYCTRISLPRSFRREPNDRGGPFVTMLFKMHEIMWKRIWKLGKSSSCSVHLDLNNHAMAHPSNCALKLVLIYRPHPVIAQRQLEQL